jgi:hypothetical protein
VNVQSVISIIGAIGGLSGLGALIAAVLTRKKVRAEAADVITDTALTLVEPLQRRVRELDVEVTELRAKVRNATDVLADAMAMIRRWRASMLSAGVDREQLREMAGEQLEVERTST